LDYIEFQNGLTITPPITEIITEDIMFEFRDVTGVIGQMYYLDMYAYYGYKVIGGIFQVDGGTTTATIKINNTEITELTDIEITNTPIPITVNSANQVQAGNSLSFLLQGFTTTPSLVRGKLLLQRT
jgi:hypothetical protein